MVFIPTRQHGNPYFAGIAEIRRFERRPKILPNILANEQRIKTSVVASAADYHTNDEIVLIC